MILTFPFDYKLCLTTSSHIFPIVLLNEFPIVRIVSWYSQSVSTQCDVMPNNPHSFSIIHASIVSVTWCNVMKSCASITFTCSCIFSAHILINRALGGLTLKASSITKAPWRPYGQWYSKEILLDKQSDVLHLLNNDPS